MKNDRVKRNNLFLVKGIVLTIIFLLATIFFYYRSNAENTYDPIYSHTDDDILVCTEFTLEIDGQQMDLYYDKDDVVFTDPDCIYPFIAPSGYPYTYANLDGTVMLVDNLWLN